jgi:predicted metalloprotease with PDZ domain
MSIRTSICSLFRSTVAATTLAAAAAAQTPARIDRFDVAGVHVTIRYLDPRIAGLHPRPQTLIRRAWPRMVELFGGPPRTSTRQAYDTFAVTLSYGPGEGSSAPQHITLQVAPESLMFGFSNWEDALLHELVHFWNANTFRYASRHEQWFSEGVTEYYALRLARALDVISANDLAAKLAILAGQYINDPAIGTLSLAGAGDERLRNYFLTYAGGATAALVLDFDIRLSTKGARSLDDVMRAMYSKYDRDAHLYTNDDVRAELETAAGKRYDDFFARYIDGAEIIPVGRYFSLSSFYYLNVPQRFDRNSDTGRTLRSLFGLP